MTTTILSLLKSLYPEATTALRHTNPYELLVATVLSAQCTDERVNLITPAFFQAYPHVGALAQASFSEVAELIRSAGLWKSKAQNLILSAQIIVAKHGGRVPQTREELEALPGVGRKTASVILATAFKIPAIAVDTHVFRVANRLGLAQAKTPRQTEEQLLRAIPQDLWIEAHHWLIYHGRAICKARNPLCSSCPLNRFCLFYNEKKSSG